MNRVFVKPAGPDRMVMIPGRPGKFVPPEGIEMNEDTYVLRCIARGDLVRAEPPKTAAPAARKE